jgi:hypothetical protein
VDAETLAIDVIADTMVILTPEQRVRVLDYCRARWGRHVPRNMVAATLDQVAQEEMDRTVQEVKQEIEEELLKPVPDPIAAIVCNELSMSGVADGRTMPQP